MNNCPKCGSGKNFHQGPSYTDFKCGSYIGRDGRSDFKQSKECREAVSRTVPLSVINQAIEALETRLMYPVNNVEDFEKITLAIAALKESL